VLGAGGYALYDRAAAAESDRAVDAARHAGVGVTTAFSAGLVVDPGTRPGVRVVNAANAAGCRRLGRFETRGDVMDPDHPTREIRHEARDRERRANTIVVTTPPPWPGQVSVEMYDCPE
jgi:hypothetical protein